MGYDHDEAEMAVAVQKMVLPPHRRGRVHPRPAATATGPAICIDAAWGFGEGVVSGDVTPDNFLVDKVLWSISRRTISPKTHAHLLTEGTGSSTRA